MKLLVNELFIRHFSYEPHGFFFSPSRVNLIGEHTDYNGGNVLPCALDLGTFAAVSPRKDKLVRLVSGNILPEKVLQSSAEKGQQQLQNSWIDYPMGVVWAMHQEGYHCPYGVDIAIMGNVPKGSGLSSSASLEMLMAFALNEIFGFGISMRQLIEICRKAESQFVGVNCGIMDMFAIGMGRKGHAIQLNCHSEEFKYIRAELGDYRFVIANTNKFRTLAGSAYNTRRKECGLALRDMQKMLQVENLAEIDPDTFKDVSHLIRNDLLFKRGRHIVTENARTIRAAAYLEKGDMRSFGKEMNESHISLRDDFEVSCDELDILTDTANECAGVEGARLTGAGFGGCAVILVKKESRESMIQHVAQVYARKTGRKAEFYNVSMSGGPRIS